MSITVTKKAITNEYANIMQVGYCELQKVLGEFNAVFDTRGIYGQNSRVYVIENMVICTGYRPFGNIRPDWLDTEKAEKEMQEYKGNNRKEKAVEILKELFKAAE